MMVAVAVTATSVRYDGHRVYRLDVNASDLFHRKIVAELHESKQWKLDWWDEVDVRIPPVHEAEVIQYLQEQGIPYHIMIENVQQLIDDERVQRDAADDDDWFASYHDFADINTFVDSLATQYPNLMSVQAIGNSYENRVITAVTVRSNATTGKIGMTYEGGIHAREWIAHATILYILNQLVTNYGKDQTITQLVDAIEWTIIPVVNPDGYDYTWTTDRMWRKTRHPNAGSSCIGVDPNRNWDNHWCQAGASKDPCDDSYCGPSAFSEIEVKTVADFIRVNRTNTQGFIDFHSYSQLWMCPYGWTDKKPTDYTAQMALGNAAAAALKAKHGTTYEVGTIYETVYPASGSSADYLYDSAHVKFPYGVELRDTGTYGFLLPASQIIPSGEETFAAAVAMAQYILAHQDA